MPSSTDNFTSTLTYVGLEQVELETNWTCDTCGAAVVERYQQATTPQGSFRRNHKRVCSHDDGHDVGPLTIRLPSD